MKKFEYMSTIRFNIGYGEVVVVKENGRSRIYASSYTMTKLKNKLNDLMIVDWFSYNPANNCYYYKSQNEKFFPYNVMVAYNE